MSTIQDLCESLTASLKDLWESAALDTVEDDSPRKRQKIGAGQHTVSPSFPRSKKVLKKISRHAKAVLTQ